MNDPDAVATKLARGEWMLEWAWLNWNDFRDMVEEVGAKPDHRRHRLAACGCVRNAWHLLDEPCLRTALEAAEDYADHTASWEQLKQARQLLAARVQETQAQVIGDKSALPGWVRDDEDAARWEMQARQLPIANAAGVVERLLRTRTIEPRTLIDIWWGVNALLPPTRSVRGEPTVYCALLRDVFGNPFRPVVFDHTWRTDTVVSLAKHMYESRDFSPMPLLADALQDAGCEDEDVLTHCRDPNSAHVRGCWVADLVLGKA